MSETDWNQLLQEAKVAKTGDYVDRGVLWAEATIATRTEAMAEFALENAALEATIAKYEEGDKILGDGIDRLHETIATQNVLIDALTNKSTDNET